MRWLKFGLVASLLVGMSAPASAKGFGIQIVPGGAGIPLAPFLDGISLDAAIPYENALLPSDGKADGTFPFARTDLTNKVGYTGAVALLYGNWEWRYTFLYLPVSKLRIVGLGFDSGDKKVGKLYIRYEDAAELLRLPPQEIDVSDAVDPFMFHMLSLVGYRFDLVEGRFRPFIPISMGLTLVTQNQLDEKLYGGFLTGGLGADYDMTEHVAVGLTALYTWIGVKNPGQLMPSLEEAAIENAKTDTALVETAIESLHLLTINVAATYYF